MAGALISKLKFHFKKHFQIVFKTKKGAHQIALGFAVGSFIAILPTPGISIFIALFLITIFRNLSKYAVLLSMLVWNPITIAPLYALSYELGDHIFGSQQIIELEINLFTKILNFSRRFLVGVLIVNVATSMLCYLSLYILIKQFGGLGIRKASKTG